MILINIKKPHDKIIMWFFLFFIFSNCALAVQHHTKQWNMLRIKNRFSRNSNWAYDAQLHARFGVDTENFDQGLTRLGLGYYLASNASLWGGYVYSATYNDTSKYENRLWQQLSWTIIDQQYWRLSSRNRLEQRKLTSAADISWRFRQKLLLTLPGFYNHKIRPIIGDEIFFNLNNVSWDNSRAVDQNRFLVGFSYAILKQMSIELFYINQYQFGSPEDEMDHIISLSFSIKPNM
jgi:hypothetical protein